MGIVLDYSNWRPRTPGELASAGVIGVKRYVMPFRFHWPKALTKPELDGLRGAGLAVGTTFEMNPGDWRNGFTGGVDHGKLAAEAMGELGLGADVMVDVAFDQDINPTDFPLALLYAQGFHSGCGHIPGAYGEGALIEFLAAHGMLVYGWESESKSFPGNATPTPHTNLVQVYNKQLPGLPGAYDVNYTITDDWGQYPQPSPIVIKPPTPQGGGTVSEEDNMIGKVIDCISEGLGQFVGVLDAGKPVQTCGATVHGPDPHVADPGSNDDWWPGTIGATVRVQGRGNHVVCTLFAPNWKPGMALPQVHAWATT